MKRYLVKIGFFFLLFLCVSAPIEAQNEFEWYDLYFPSMETTVTITEDGLYTIDTRVEAQFNNSGRGIEVWIPQDYNITFDVDGKEVNRRYYWPVSNINVENEQSTVYEENSYKVIRIGNPNVYIEGLRTYHYSYQIQTSSLNIDDYERIMWDVLGNDWRVPIENFAFTINLPKSVDAQPYVYSGVYGQVTNDKITFEFDGTTLTGQSSAPLQPGEGVTVYLDVPLDYFSFAEPFNFVPVVVGTTILMAIISFFLFLRYGKDYPVIQTVEIDAPEGYSSAMVGFAYDGDAGNKDILSLIVQWASEGLLAIRELDKDNMELTKLKEIPLDAPAFEAKLFNGLFDKGDIIETDDLKNTFYTKIESAKHGLTHFFQKKNYRLYYPHSTGIKALLTVIAPGLLAMFVAATIQINMNYSPIVLPAFLITFGVGLIYSIFIVVGFSNFSIRSTGIKALLVGLGVLFTTILLAVLGGVLTMFNAFDIWLFVAIGCFLLILLLAINMTKRTPYGTEIYGKILGLRTFIKEAELDELEMLVHDDPKFFYRVLPFAYVLGLSDTWSKKFETLAVPAPEWYSGTSPNFSTILFMNQMNRMMYVTSTAMTSVPAPKGGGGGGGSFGGGGGGGFSGGGFGGGGGGGW